MVFIDLRKEAAATMVNPKPSVSEDLSSHELNLRYQELAQEYERTSDVSKLHEALAYVELAVEFATEADNSNDRAAYLNNLGRCYRLLFKATGDRNYVDRAVNSGRDAVTAAKDLPHLHSLCRANLSESLAERYLAGDSTDKTDLHEALAVAREAVAYSPEGSPYQSSALSTLSSRLGQYYEYVENSDAFLDEAINIGRKLIAIQSDEQRGIHAINLAVDLKSRYGRYGQVEDLLEAKTLFAQASEDFPPSHVNRLAAVRQLSDCVVDLCERRSEPEMISEALAAMEGLILEEATDIDKAKYFYSRCRLQYARYKQSSDAKWLEDALEDARKSLALSSSRNAMRSIVLGKLSEVLSQSAEYHMRIEEMDEAIEYANEAISITMDLPARQASAYNTLGKCLDTKFTLFGDEDSLHASLKVKRDTLDLLPPGHNDRPTRVHALAIALRRFFEQSGDAADLDESIKLEREAFAILDAKKDPDRSMAMDGLSHSLSMRARLTGNSHDVEEAVEASKAAVAAALPGSTQRSSYLNSLANRLSSRYSLHNNRQDLDEAIEAVNEAVSASAGDTSSEVVYLVTLSNCLATRFELSKEESDLDESLKAIRTVLDLCTLTNPARHGYRHNLGLRLHKKYETTADEEQRVKFLQEAHDIEAEVVESLPENHPDLPGYLTILATRQLYLALFMDPKDEPALYGQLRTAGETFVRAYKMTYATPLQRITNGDFASVCLLPLDEWENVANILSDCVRMFRLVSPPSLDEQDRQRQLRGLSGISTRAATCYICLGRLDEALEVLEAGRGIMANIAMGYHANLTPINQADPDLHDQYVKLRNSISRPLEASSSHSIDTVGIRNRELAAMEELESRIHRLPGLEDFNRGLTAKQMRALASEGPLVCFCASDQRCDALIVTTQAIEALPLPELKRADVLKRVGLVVGDQRLSNAKPASNPNKKMKALLAWLWDKAVRPVLDHLKLLEKSASDDNRLWWVSSGPLGLLPLHAAGKGVKHPFENTYAHVISSYTPSFSALHFARQCQKRVKITLPKAALITMPHTPGGLGDLATEAESQAIREAFAALNTGEEHLTELCQPNAEEVLQRVRRSGIDIFHFACHAEPDLNDPSKAALLFGKDPSAHEPDLLPVKELRRYDGESASEHNKRAFRLAYLSACCTAQQYDMRLIDENIHLAAAFQLSGFPSVIGTLWEADDAAAVVVARAFYKELFRLDWVSERDEEASQAGNVARAWHAATEACRQRKVDRGNAADDVLAWASFVHIGV